MAARTLARALLRPALAQRLPSIHKMGTSSEPIKISSSISFSSDDDPSDDDSITYYDSDMPKPKRGQFTLRGPMVDGEEEFDDHCIFANKMLIDRSQVHHLRDMVDEYPGEPIKYYVYKLCSSSVKKNGKMEFESNFTKKIPKEVPSKDK